MLAGHFIAMEFAAFVITLFLVLDPFGNAPVFHPILQRVPAERRGRVLVRELLIAYGILLFFLIAGDAILSFLGIRSETLSVSGGILLFLIALGMVFPAKSVLVESGDDEPFIVPLAVPMIAGPSAIALLLLLSSKHPGSLWLGIGAVTAAWAATAIILMLSPVILDRIGRKGAQAMERLMGLVLILISVQMFIDGLGGVMQPASP